LNNAKKTALSPFAAGGAARRRDRKGDRSCGPLTALFIDDTVAGLARVLRAGAPDLDAPMVSVNGGGHCNGAFVAFEMARQLLRQGEQVPAVVMIEARAPSGGGSTGHSVPGETHVTFDPDGGVRVLAARDRQSDAELRHSRAMDRYAGGPYAGRVVIIRSRRLDDARPDLGWAHLAASAEIHVLPGDHVTLVTRYVSALAKVTREAIGRVLERTTR